MAKLLVIDDDPDILKLIRKTLEKDGHQVDVETDPAPLRPDRCRQYDLILLDVMIPGEDGFSFCRQKPFPHKNISCLLPKGNTGSANIWLSTPARSLPKNSYMNLFLALTLKGIPLRSQNILRTSGAN